MKVIKVYLGIAMIVAGAMTGNFMMAIAGAQLVGSALITPKKQTAGESIRPASATTIQLGEVPRQAIFGRAATAGSLVDAFNYGGKYDTDWEVLVLDLADHRCDALEGFYVNDVYVPFTGDGTVAGYNGQLSVWWRPGTENQGVPDVLLAHGPGWTADDNGAGVAHVVVAYKADDAEAKEPVWPGGRPRFLWIVRGALCYSARADGSIGGAGPHRWGDPSTRAWSENPIDCRYTWARGLYACDRVGDPSQLMIGRGLSAIEAPPANVFHRANLCDEAVDGAPRYRVGAIVEATSKFIDVEQDFAAACAGTITQPQGSVEIDPGEARAAIVAITDDDLVVGTKVSWNNGILSSASAEWINTVVARYVEPSLKWADHAAPVRRDIADVLTDRQPREERIGLGFVTDGAQAGRIAEIRRRMGRLPGRATITLPPRFAFIEEGDWIVWHSPRRFGAQALTFRVDAWGSDAGWRHQVSLRQISASVYSDTAALDDGSVAVAPPVVPPIGAPLTGSWSVTAGYQAAGDIRTPVLIVEGQSDDPAARFVQVEYREETDAGPGAWSGIGVSGPDVRRLEIPVAAGGRFSIAVSYVVNGVTGDPLVIGPVTAGATLHPDGTPVSQMIDRGPYDPLTLYLHGNIVGLPDGSRWKRVSTLAAIGDRPKPGSLTWECVQGPTKVLPPDAIIGAELDPITGQPIGGLPLTAAIPRIERIPAIEAAIEPISDLAEKVAGLIDAAPVQDAAIQALVGVTAGHDDALATAARAAGDIEEALLALLAQASEQRQILRDAGIVVDPAAGTVSIYAVEQLRGGVTKALIDLDAVKGQITTRVTRAELDDAILEAAIDPSQLVDLRPLLARLVTAETRLDAQAAAVELRATIVELSAAKARMTQAEQRLDAQAAAIEQRVTRTVFEGLEAEVGEAKSILEALPSGLSTIGFEVRQARLIADADEDAQLWDLIRGVEERDARVAQIAEARSEITAQIIDGQRSEARQRLALAAQLGDLDARAVSETVARVEQGKVLSQQLNALGIQTAGQATAIGELREAAADGKASTAAVRDTIRQVARASDAGDADAEDAMLAALADGFAADERQRYQIAEAMREMTTSLVLGESVSAAARERLAVQIAAATASIETTRKVVSDLTGSTARSIAALAATFDTQVAGVEQRFGAQVLRLDEAVAEAGRSSAQAVSQVRADLSDAIDDATRTVDDRVTAQVRRLDDALAEESGTRARSIQETEARFSHALDDAAEATAASVRRLDQADADEATARAHAIEQIEAQIGDVEAGIVRLDDAVADEAGARAQAIERIETKADNAAAGVARLDKAVTEDGESFARAVEQVTARIGLVEAEAAIQKTALVDLEGKVIAYLILEAVAGSDRARVKIAANGYEGSLIDLLANAITLANDVDGQVLTALRAVGGNIEVGHDLLMANGRIISRSGDHMTVTGKPFGTSSQFIKWYGPRMPLDQCAEGNAISFERVDGKGYTRTALIAGKISNAVQTSSVAIDAAVTTGPVGSLGGQRIVAVSYALFAQRQHFDTRPAASGPARAVVILSRNGVDVDTLVIDGTWQRDQSFGESEPASYQLTVVGAKTFYDNSGGETVTYAARLVQRDEGTGAPASGGGGAGTYTQSISIVQSEG